jgi:hypothetical protein
MRPRVPDRDDRSSERVAKMGNRERLLRRGLPVLAALLCAAGLLLATSFYFIDNHAWYWNVAHVVSVLGALLAAAGGFLLGRSCPLSRKRHDSMIALGGILGLAWAASALFAFGLSFAGVNYLSGDSFVNWDSYHGDYLVGWFQIRLLQLSTLTGILGGLFVSAGVAPGKSRARPKAPHPPIRLRGERSVNSASQH